MPPYPVRHLYSESGVDIIEIAKYTVNTTDVFDDVLIYTMMHEWLADNGWWKDDSNETFMLMREAPFGKEFYIRWRVERDPSNFKKLFKFKMDFNFHLFGIKKKEIMHKGKKLKMKEGEFEVEVVASLIIDKKSWETSILKPWRNIYINRIIREQRDRLMGELWEDAYRLRDAIMSYMKQDLMLGSKGMTEFWGTRTPE